MTKTRLPKIDLIPPAPDKAFKSKSALPKVLNSSPARNKKSPCRNWSPIKQGKQLKQNHSEFIALDFSHLDSGKNTALDKALKFYIDQIWSKFDSDYNDVLDKQEASRFFDEFIEEMSWRPPKSIGQPEQWKQTVIENIFEQVDLNQDQTIDRGELYQYLRQQLSEFLAE